MNIELSFYDAVGEYLRSYNLKLDKSFTIDQFFEVRNLFPEDKYVHVNEKRVNSGYVLKDGDSIQIQHVEYIRRV